MEKFQVSTLIVTLFAGMVLLTACDKAPPPAPAPKAEAPAPAPEQTPPASTAPAESPAATADAAHAPLPPACENYVAQIKSCIEKLGTNAAAADALKQQMDQNIASWSQIPNQEALGSACQQTADMFANHGCPPVTTTTAPMPDSNHRPAAPAPTSKSPTPPIAP